MKRKFFESIIGGNRTPPPESFEKNLMMHFKDAINIEWYKKGQDFEAIFYNQQIEHIARFNPEGEIIEYKINIPENQLPSSIVEKMHSIGEIMNSVVINRQSNIRYEIIARNQELQRFVVVVDEQGNILERRSL